MRSSTLFLSLAFGFVANAIDISIGPDTVCGANSVDCGKGFCCSSGSKCDTSGTITTCGTDGTPAKPYDLGSIGSAIAGQVESLKDLPASLAGEFSSLVDAIPSDVANSAKGVLSSFAANHQIPTGAELSSFVDSLPTSARGPVNSALNSLQAEISGILGGAPTGAASGQGQNTQDGSGAATFGNTAAMLAYIWGVAALGGMALVL